MSFNEAVAGCMVAVGFFASAAARPPDSGDPTHPAASCSERCTAALAPVLGVKPEKPTDGDAPMRRLMKLRHASAFRRLELIAARVDERAEALEKLLPILEDVREARMELYDDPSSQIPALEAQVEIAGLIEVARACELEEGRAAPYVLEDARHARLVAEVRLARAKAASSRSRQGRWPQRPDPTIPPIRTEGTVGPRAG